MKPDAIRERLATLDPRGWKAVPEPVDAERPLTPAAVLIPLVTHAEGLSAIFTERTAHLHDHAGQVSFPGGRYEKTDDNAVATALREADEEIGLRPEAVEIIGCLDAHDTSSGFSVVPVVGLVTPPYSLILDEFEVAEAFEVPLSFLFDPANKRREEAFWHGEMCSYDIYSDYDGHMVWGVTARIVGRLQEVLLRP